MLRVYEQQSIFERIGRGFDAHNSFWYVFSGLLLVYRIPVALTDRLGMRLPILKDFFSSVGAIEGTREAALRALQQGKIVGVAPGGLREAIAGSKFDYQLLWGNRIGFAQLALQTGTPIYPCFTKNVESLYKNPLGGSRLTRFVYEKAHLPLTPPIGLGPLPFPVKLTTFVGDPINSSHEESAKSLAAKTKNALEALMRKKG